MDKVVFAILIHFLITAVYCYSLHPESCKKLPKENHCIIENAANTTFAYTNRYYYNNSTEKCVLMRWSDNCSVPNGVNNFASESDCKYNCPGVPYQNCMKELENKQCIIDRAYILFYQLYEYSFRYYYNWDKRECEIIRWAATCGIPEPTANNFKDRQSCYDKCVGYA